MSSTTVTEATPAVAEKLTLAFDNTVHQGVNMKWCPHLLRSGEQAQYKYSNYLPVYDNETIFPPLEPTEFVDRGLAANKSKPNLLRKNDPSVVITKLTPLVGTEIRGLQLSQLTDSQKDELALLIAERSVVVFRDQDFKDIGPEKQKAFGSYFGKLHVHVTLSLFPMIPPKNLLTNNQARRRSCKGPYRVPQYIPWTRQPVPRAAAL